MIMKKTWKLALLAAVAAFGISGCSEDSATGPAAPRLVEMPTPTGWKRTENYRLSSTVTADYVLYGPAVGNFSPNVVVLTASSRGISLDSAGRMYVAQVNGMGGTVDSSHAVRIGGVDGWLVQYRLSMTYGNVVERDILLIYKGKDCQISLTRLDGDAASEAILQAQQAAITLN